MSPNKKHVLVLNGPNLNLLGLREPEIYGSDSLKTIEKNLKNKIKNFKNIKIKLEFFQSNSEQKLIEKLQQFHLENSSDNAAIIINPAGLTHTSIILRDALLIKPIPFIEVHISNIFAREEFRKHSVISDKAIAIVSGMGVLGYEYALDYLINND